jgi:hypothetical protein
MRTIARLFGKSPFAPLKTHMARVADCIEKLTVIIPLLKKNEMAKIEKHVSELRKLEHEADLLKNDIRNHLPRSIFLPIDRTLFLDILSVQDKIADKAEEIGLLLTMHPLEEFAKFEELFLRLLEQNIAVFEIAHEIIQEIDELLESSFGGIEAEKVKSMVEKTALLEHNATETKHELLKSLFTHGLKLSPPAFYLWTQLIEETGKIATYSERLANRIRMVLELN